MFIYTSSIVLSASLSLYVTVTVNEAIALYKKHCAMLLQNPITEADRAALSEVCNSGIEIETIFKTTKFLIQTIPVPMDYWKYISIEWIIKNMTALYGMINEYAVTRTTKKISKKITELLDKEAERIRRKK